VLNLLKPRFLASLRNDTKMNCDTVSEKRGSSSLCLINPCCPPALLHDEPVNITFRDFRLNVLVAVECNIWRIGFGLVVKIGESVKSRKSDGTVKSCRCKARKSDGMRRTYLYAAMTEDAAQRRRWTFYEAVKIHFKNFATI